MPINPWRFASKRYDPETGFSYFLNRYYSPSLGRWITPDPLGFTDGPNMYAYVHNNPMTGYDLWGLWNENIDYDNDDTYLPHVQFSAAFVQRYMLNQCQSLDSLGILARNFVEHPLVTSEVLLENAVSALSSVDFTSTIVGIYDLYSENNWDTASGRLAADLTPGVDRFIKNKLMKNLRLSAKIPHENKNIRNSGRGKNKLRPHEKTSKESTFPGSHSTFKKDHKTGKITHYATWKANTNPNPLDPHPSPFKLRKEYHGTGKEPGGHFMKQNDTDSGYPHVHRTK